MKYIFKLYVFNETANSVRAIKNLKKITKKFLKEQYTIDIIDIIETPKLAIDGSIVAVPTLIKSFPPPYRKVIGDLSDTENVVVSLGLKSLIKDETSNRMEVNNE